MFDVTFHGAAREVTGSCHLLNVEGKHILLDCGLFQGRRSESLEKNQEFPIDPSKLHSVILSHAHIDHCGRLPLLVKRGFTGTIYATAATRDLCLFHDADVEYQVSDARAVVRAVLSPSGGQPCAMAIGVRAWRLSWLPVVSFTVNALIRAILRLRFGAAPDDVLTGTRCLSRDFFLQLDTASATFAIETELTRLVMATGGEVVGVPVRYTPRTRAQGKKISLRHLWPIIAEACATRTPALVAREGITARAQ